MDELEIRLGHTTVARSPITADAPSRFSTTISASHFPEGQYRLQALARSADGTRIGRGKAVKVEVRRDARWTSSGKLRFGLAMIALCAMLWLARRSGRAAWLAPAVVGVELFWFGFDYNGYFPEETVYPRPS